MKKFFLYLLLLLSFSCSSSDKNPLIVPPNYSEIPKDYDHNDKIKENIGNQENIDKLKEILLKND